ncbi:MAG: hypothetical protein EXS08_02485 [Planctomycetes bacterium]|nr:hypothetical protein [Planctomycetota bacterium]
MHFPLQPWPALFLATALTLLTAGQEPKKARVKGQQPKAEKAAEPVAQGPKGWDPYFDYTTLPLTNEAFWEPLKATTVSMEAAWDVVKQSEGGTLFPLNVQFVPAAEGGYWAFQVFAKAGEDEKPRRINLRVSAAEPKITKRLELLSLLADEEALWPALHKTKTPLEIAIQLCKDHSAGNKEDQLLVNDPRMRTAQFVPAGDATHWRIEMMGIERDLVRRFEIEVNTKEPRLRRNMMLDRFAGEPLRKLEPTEMPNGMLVCDIVTGDGQEISADSKVKVNYRLFLLDNTRLHDTWKTKLPETFPVAEAPLKGMSEGLVGMRVGGKRKLCIPYEKAFGEKGTEVAPPKAMVICDVAIEELVGP